MMVRTFAETFYEGASACRTGSGVAGIDKPLLGTRRSRRRLGYASPSLKLSEDTAHIERQDASGVWRRVSTTRNDLQYILKRMQEVKASFPHMRVRAVDDDGKLIDILP
jgi:hypothetical protein